MRPEWRDFSGGVWEREINVRDFIQKNYTPYDGDDTFLAGPTQATRDLWAQVMDLTVKEREAGGVLDMDTKIVSTITSHGPGYLEKMEKDGFRIRFFGDLEALPPELRTLCLETEETGAAVAGAKYQINVCLNYGGRDEILRAARAWGRDVLAGRQGVEDLTDEVFSRYLDSRAVPDPDLIIRPSGELRLSNFLPWQSAYAEFYFTDVLWPDFSPAVLDAALVDFQRRQRRFGGV